MINHPRSIYNKTVFGTLLKDLNSILVTNLTFEQQTNAIHRKISKTGQVSVCIALSIL